MYKRGYNQTKKKKPLRKIEYRKFKKNLGKGGFLENVVVRQVYCFEFVLNLKLFSELFVLGEEEVSVFLVVLLAGR